MNVLGIALGVLLLPGVVQQAIQPAPLNSPIVRQASVEGVVVKAGTGEAVRGAQVVLVQTIAAPVVIVSGAAIPTRRTYRVTTSERGQFSLEAEPGIYQLAVSRDGFTRIEFGQPGPHSAGKIIELKPEQKLSDVRISLDPAGSIFGRILENGKPAARVTVQALQPMYQDGARVMGVAQSVITDDRGEYRLFWLPAGRYYVSAVRAAATRLNDRLAARELYIDAGSFSTSSFSGAAPGLVTNRRLEDGGTQREVVPEVYFPGATDIQMATPLDLLPGGNMGGIDFALAPAVRVHRIRGEVVQGPGEPVYATVNLIPRDPNSNLAFPKIVADGPFEFSAVPPGSYWLSVFKLAIGGHWTGKMAIDVGSQDVDNLRIAVTRGFDIHGHVTMAPQPSLGTPPPPLSNVILTPVIKGMPAPPSLGVPALPDLSFSASDVPPGDYRVFLGLGLMPNAYVKSARMGTVDVLNGGLRLDGAPEAPLEIIVGTNGGTIEGRTLDRNQTPLSSITVVLVPDPKLRNRIDLYKNASTDVSGRFVFVGVPPGEYKVFAWEDVPNTAWRNAEFMRVFEDRGTPVQAADGARENLQLTVIPVDTLP